MSDSLRKAQETDLGKSFTLSQDFFSQHVPGWGDELQRMAQIYNRIGSKMPEEKKVALLQLEMKAIMDRPYTYDTQPGGKFHG